MADPELEAQLAELRRGYASRIPERLAAIDRAAGSALDGDGGRAALEELHHLLHKLAGSGASFGFADVSTAARAAEATVKGSLADAGPIARERREALGSQLAELRRACAAAGS